MKDKYDALVLGSGIGGLAAALMLSHDGKRVALFEKHKRPGGRLGSFFKEGFTVDFGVHLVSRGEKSPVIQILNRCGVSADISFTKVRPVQSTGGEQFKFPHDLKGKVSDQDFQAVIRFVSQIKDMSDEETAALDDLTLEEYLNRYTTNPFAHACISMVGFIYCCIPEFKLSAGEFARCLKWEAEARASGYPSGGCVAITNAYINGLKKNGVDLFLDTPVEKILVEDGRAMGVLAQGTEYRADSVISNAGIKQTVLELVGEDHFSPEYVSSVKDLEYSCVSIIARFA
ncbi:MAG: FAD-dependent oxidoreductase, partial [Coriobacteriales bacterium]|nr:FAD-dependent oxidoreductase [Coriobacteriales bacterium]